MGRKSKYSKELKVEIVKRYLKGESASTLANEYELTGKRSEDKIRTWSHRYEAFGEAAFDNPSTNKSYSKSLKDIVIKEYLLGGTSSAELAIKYNISTSGIVRSWIKKYNNGIEIKDYDPKSEVYTMKPRKTTKERLEIVNYLLSNDNNYKEAANKYSVPYASVYQWVKKFNELGEDGLLDKCGRPTTS